MKLLIDENLPFSIAQMILERFQASLIVRESSLQGKSDRSLYEFANKKDLIIITLDNDFCNLIQFPIDHTPGRIVLRYKNLSISQMRERIEKLLDKFIQDKLDITGKLIIAGNKKLRIKSRE